MHIGENIFCFRVWHSYFDIEKHQMLHLILSYSSFEWDQPLFILFSVFSNNRKILQKINKKNDLPIDTISNLVFWSRFVNKLEP